MRIQFRIINILIFIITIALWYWCYFSWNIPIGNNNYNLSKDGVVLNRIFSTLFSGATVIITIIINGESIWECIIKKRTFKI